MMYPHCIALQARMGAAAKCESTLMTVKQLALAYTLCLSLHCLTLPCIGLHNNSAWNNCPPCSPDGMLAFLLTVPYMLDTSSTLCFSVNGKLVKYQVGCLSPRKYIMMVGICKGSPEESTKVLLKVPPEGMRVRRKTRVKVPERSECGIRP